MTWTGATAHERVPSSRKRSRELASTRTAHSRRPGVQRARRWTRQHAARGHCRGWRSVSAAASSQRVAGRHPSRTAQLRRAAQRSGRV